MGNTFFSRNKLLRNVWKQKHLSIDPCVIILRVLCVCDVQGIPYAEPPERFQPSTPKSPWSGELNATSFKPACAQAPSFYFPEQDEDCLYLNVYAPNPKVDMFKASCIVIYKMGRFECCKVTQNQILVLI